MSREIRTLRWRDGCILTMTDYHGSVSRARARGDGEVRKER
jgi:hypothetical protein